MSKKVLTGDEVSDIIQIVQNGQEHVQKSDKDKEENHDTDKMCIGRARIHGDGTGHHAFSRLGDNQHRNQHI